MIIINVIIFYLLVTFGYSGAYHISMKDKTDKKYGFILLSIFMALTYFFFEILGMRTSMEVVNFKLLMIWSIVCLGCYFLADYQKSEGNYKYHRWLDGIGGWATLGMYFSIF